MMEPDIYKSNLNKGFSKDEIQILMKYNLAPPSEILQVYMNKAIDMDKYYSELGARIQNLGISKDQLSHG